MYAATVNGKRLHFYPEAVWRRNMIMRDKETGTLWQHATGEALIGPLKGTQLEILGGSLMNWGEWKLEHPNTTLALEPEEWKGILSREKVLELTDLITPSLRLPGVVNDKRLPFNEEVVGIVLNGESYAYSISALREEKEIIGIVGNTEIRVCLDLEGNHVSVVSADGPIRFERGLWLGWSEFHPTTGVYKSPKQKPN